MKSLSILFLTPTLLFLFTSCESSKGENQQPSNVNSDIASWNQLDTNFPEMRSEYAMAYNIEQKKIIVYGGRTGFRSDFQNVNDTWAFDYKAKTWVNLQPNNSPSWRSSHKMVYDPVRKKSLMFGGTNFDIVFNDLWEYDYENNNWTNLSPSNPPEGRQMHGMVFIPEKAFTIIFGGRKENGGAAFNDLWKYDYNLNEWQNLNPANSPPFQDHVNIVYYASVDKLILFAGPENNPVPRTYAYDFDTNNWTDLNAINTPDGDHSNLVYDAYHEKLILFGSSLSANGMSTWNYKYNDNMWTNITPKSMADVYIEHDNMVYLNDHHVIIQYGGCCSDATLELKLNK